MAALPGLPGLPGLASRSGVRRLFRLRPSRPELVDAEVEEEIRLHLELRVEQLVARGMTPEAARREALARFGPLDEARRTLRHSARRREERLRMRDTLDALAHDLRFALRGLRKRPAFTAAVALTLALGIGANATMFGIVDRLLLQPPAFLLEPDRTGRVFLWRTFDEGPQAGSNFQYRRYLDLTEGATRTLERTAAFFSTEVVFGEGEEAKQERLHMASASFWSFFRVAPVVGRFFGPEDDKLPNGAPVVVLSHGYWQSKFGGDPAVVGKALRIGKSMYTVIGVAPRGFLGMNMRAPAAFMPITAGASELFGGNQRRLRDPWYETYNMSWMEMLARRRPGVTAEQASADLSAAYVRSYQTQLAKSPGGGGLPIEKVKPRAELGSAIRDRGPNGRQEARVATWLGGVSLLVLLIACANVASLLLARAVERRREIAVRVALGVSRRRLLGQLLVESTLLAAIGGLVGLLAAHWGGGLLRRTLLPDVEWGSMLLDARVLGFAALAALLAGVFTGLAPAVQVQRADVSAALKAGGREGSLRRSRLRTGLLVLQGAVSVLLLVGAGLFVRSLHNVRGLDLGYDPERVVYVSMEMRGTQLDSAARVALGESLRERAAALPNVESAAHTLAVPFYMTWSENVRVPGVDSTKLRDEYFMNAVSPEYFATSGIRLVRGRGISATDRVGTPRVVVVSEQTARTIWPGQEAVGKCLRRGADTTPCEEVVGVAEDVRLSFEDGPARHVYLPLAQEGNSDAGIYVRTRGEARRHTETIRRELQKLMPGAAFVETRALDEIVAPAMRSWQLGATMFTLFGLLALLVAAVGLYSVIAYNVAQRTHELGVRMALGARTGDVLRLVVGEGLRVTVVAVALGGAAALLAGRWVKPLLYEVSEKDPATYVGVAVALLVVAAAASLVPARRASRVDPSVALRSD